MQGLLVTTLLIAIIAAPGTGLLLTLAALALVMAGKQGARKGMSKSA